MKIVYLTDTFFPQVNGVITSLATISAALAKQGHEVVIFVPKPANHQKISWHAEGVRIEMLPSIPALIYPEFRAASPVSLQLLNKLRAIDPDIIHFQTAFLLGGGGLVLGRLLKKPIIGSFHGYFMESEYLKILKVDQVKILSSLLWNYSAWFYNQCDGVLTFAQSVKKDLLLHKIHRPIHVIPNTISENNIRKASADEVQALRLSLGLKKQVVLYVGRLSAEKSLDVLIDSFAKVAKQKPDTSLLLIGDGPKKHILEKHMASLGLKDKVIFTGLIKSDDLMTKGYYQLADVFATASTSEVQPVSMLEAMYFTLPLVGVAKRGVGDLVQHVGLLAKPGDTTQLANHIVSILSQSKLRATLAEKSKQKYRQEYSLKHVVKEYETYYEHFINKEHEKPVKPLHQRILHRIKFS